MMKELQNQQQQGEDAFALLTDDTLLTLIFEFVGVFEYRFVASLNKRFRKLYSKFQRKRIHRAPKDPSENYGDYSRRYKYFSKRLTSTTSVAESIDRAKLVMTDMKTGKCNHFIKLCKCKEDGTPYGSFYDVVDHIRISGTNPNQIRLFLRDKVALRYGTLEILQWLVANGCPWNKSTCTEVASNGHLEILKWVRAIGCPWGTLTCAKAAGNGHLEVVRWARANGCPWNVLTCDFAARNGHLELLQWASAKGCPWNSNTCAEAARNRHLEVLQWAHANGCPWDDITCELAARNGHLEVLRWARANGCPWGERTCAEAARNGHLEVLQWLRANGCPWDGLTCKLAAGNGHLEVLKWASANGCPLIMAS